MLGKLILVFLDRALRWFRGGGILSGPEIERQVWLGNIVIEPYRPEFVGPNSVDVHLGVDLFTYDRGSPLWTKQWALDPRALPPLVRVPLEADGRWLLRPGWVYIGCAVERTRTVGFVPVIDGRSSCGRIGVSAHQTAGRGDDGFDGRFTVEISVAENVLVEPGGRYFQISYLPVLGRRRPYNGRYQGDLVPVGSRIHEQVEGVPS